MFAELIEHSMLNRGQIVNVSDLGMFSKERNYPAWSSAYQFDQKILEYVKLSGKVKGYGEEAGTGKVYSEIMWIDIDNKNLIKAQTAAMQIISQFNKKYELFASDLLIFFSGKKGFHIGLHKKLFNDLIGQGGFDHHIRIKMMAFEMVGDIEIDPKIYNKTRIFRLPNSTHQDTGLYKIPISYEELSSSIESIKELAKNSRTDWKYNVANLKPNAKLVERWQSISIQEQTYVREEINGGFFTVPQEGHRDDTMFRQACMLLDHGLSENWVADIMDVYRQSSNIGANDAITPRDLGRILQSAITKTANNVQKSIKEKIDAKIDPGSRIELGTFGDYIDQYHDYLNDDSGRIWLNNKYFDKHLRGRLRGKVCAMIGYGGSKKSLRALQILLFNIRKSKIRGVYSTMEQGVFGLMDRIINYSVDPTGNVSVSDRLWEEEDYRTNARQILRNDIAPIYGKNLWLTPTTSISADEYDKMLRDLNEREGQIDMLVIDGLSRMGGDGNEVERTVKAMREINDLAKRWNIFIIVMCHVSRGLTPHSRDVRAFIRGGEKVADEADFNIMRSRIIDPQISTSEKIEYRNDLGWERLYDKRGTGVSVDVIDLFNRLTLAIDATEMDPLEHEHVIKKGGGKDFGD